MEKLKNGKLPFLVKLGYGGIEGSCTSIWILVYLYMLFFLTDVVKINPAVAGSILMIATIWDAISGLGIGIFSDRVKSKWGRRRPFLLVAAIPFGVSSWLLFTDFQLGPTLNIVYFIGMVILFFTFLSMLNVPYSALGAEMTQSYTERMSLVSYRMGWGQFLGLFAAALPLIMVEFFSETFGSTTFGWSAMAACFGVFVIFPVLLTWRTTRGYELFPETPDFKLSDVYNVILHNRSFRYMIGIWTFGIGATILMASMLVYHMRYIMGFDDEKTGLAFTVMFIVGLLYIPLINKVVKKIGKQMGFIVFALFWGLINGGLLIMVSGPENEILFWIVNVTGFAMSSVLVYLMGWAMIPDITEVDELITGQRREGLFFGIMAFIQKLASAATVQIIGLILAWVGYQPDVVQTEEAQWGIRMLISEGPVILLAIAIILAYFMPMTREKHRALRDILKLKKENKEYDMEPVKNLL